MYTLILTNLVAIKVNNSLRIDELWSIDLAEHSRYISDLQIVGRLNSNDGCHHSAEFNKAPVGCEWGRFTWLRGWTSGWQFLVHFIDNFQTIRYLIKKSTIVHTGVVGWPLPDGYYVIPISIFYKKKVVVVLESGDWSVPTIATAGMGRAFAAHVKRWWTRLLLNRCSLVVSTNAGYLKQLHLSRRVPKEVIPASWISEKYIIPSELLDSRKIAGVFRLAFFGRLVKEKGVLVLIDAIQKLAQSSKSVILDVYGSGEMSEELNRVSEKLVDSSVRVNVMGVIDYGTKFFDAIDQYSAVVVPSITQEQPRIIYDVFARGGVVIASNTIGNSEVITDGITGFLFEQGDASALAEIIVSVASSEPFLEEIRKAARRVATNHTHQAMHRKRKELLIRYVGL